MEDSLLRFSLTALRGRSVALCSGWTWGHKHFPVASSHPRSFVEIRCNTQGLQVQGLQLGLAQAFVFPSPGSFSV